MENKNTSEKKLTKGDLINMWIRSNFQQASFNYERIHALGFCYDMVPAIKRLYKTKEDQVAALKRHLLFFNVTPACTGPILGVVGAMEETIKALRAAGDFKIIVGGAVLTQDYADSIGADCYAPNAVSAVNYANSLQ